MNARLPIDELGELFGLDLEDEDVDSAGGLLAKELGRLPLPGRARDRVGARSSRPSAPRAGASASPPILVERDQALIDAQSAFDTGELEGRNHRG